MFERAIFRGHSSPSELLERLAELLLYYKDVEVLLDDFSFGTLLKTIGPDALLRMAKLPNVRAAFLKDVVGTPVTNSFITSYQPTLITMRPKSSKKDMTAEEKIMLIYERTFGGGFRTRKKAQFLGQYFTSASVQEYTGRADITNLAAQDIIQPKFSQEAAEAYIQRIYPSTSIPENFRFRAHALGDQILVDSNVCSFLNPPGQNIIERILTNIFSASIDLYVAGNRQGDFYTGGENSRLLDLRLHSALEGAARATDTLDLFQERILQGRTVGAALQTGHCSFDQVLDVVEEAEKYRKWIGSIGDDSNLADEYIAQISRESWLDKLPNKSLRFMFFSTAGLGISAMTSPVVGGALALGLNAVDQFLVDKIVRGWKPNHFVNNSLDRIIA